MSVGGGRRAGRTWVFCALLAVCLGACRPAVAGLIQFDDGEPSDTAAFAQTAPMLWGWGYNQDGQPSGGRPSMEPILVPTAIGDLHDVRLAAAGHEQALAVASDGTLWSWGWQGVGPTGQGGRSTVLVPTSAGAAERVVRIGVGQHFGLYGRPVTFPLISGLALTSSGTLWQWGSGTLSRAVATPTPRGPRPLSGLSHVREFALGEQHALALSAD